MLIGPSESNEPAPLSLWHCDPELCSIEKRFNWKGRTHFMGRPTPLKVNGANFSTPSPQGCNFYHHFEVWSYRACQPLQMWPISHFCEIHSLSYEAQIFFANVKSMGHFGTLLPPQGCNFYPFLRCGLTEPASLFKCGKFHISVKSTLWAYEASKFFAMLSQCVWFCPYFAPGGKHRTPDRL